MKVNDFISQGKVETPIRRGGVGNSDNFFCKFTSVSTYQKLSK